MEKMDGGLIIKQKPITLSLFIFTFLFFLFIDARAQADTYCVGCDDGTAATCDGGAACAALMIDPGCNGGNTGFICSDIADALDCIDDLDDANAEIIIAQNPPMMPYTGPGDGFPIDNTAMMDQTINILGGWSSSNCGSQTLNPSNTIIQAPANDRVLFINNTMSDLLTVTLEGLTITGGDTMSICGPSIQAGGGVCVTSTLLGTGGVMFTSSSNIYDGNTAGAAGGGLAVANDSEGNFIVTIVNDKFSNNSSPFGGAMFFTSSSSASTSLDATIDNTIIGGNAPFPNGGNEASTGGGIAIRGLGAPITVSNQGNTIMNNTTLAGGGADLDGGGAGIYIINDESVVADVPVKVSLEDDHITFNEAAGEPGGGISIETDLDATVDISISKTEIGNNSSDTFGGGIAIFGEGIVNLSPVVNNIIHNNIAFGTPNGGGGVAAVTLGADADNADFDIKFVNNTISDNKAPTAGAMGGGILADSSADTGMGTIDWTLPNDIIFFNSSAGTGDQVALVNPGDNATIVLRFTDVSNQPADLSPAPIVGPPGMVGELNLVENNIFTDPQFIDPFMNINSYHIQPGSPAATPGTHTAILTVAGVEASPPPDDFDGVPRDISIGAYEVMPSPTPTPTPTVTPTPSPTPTTPPPPTPTPTIAPPTPTPTPQDMLVFSNANNGKIVTIQSEPGTTIQGGPLGKTLEGCPKVINDKFVTFPVGTYEYFITGLNPGDATMVVIELPPGTEVNSYFVFGKKPGDDQDHCYEFLFDGTTGAQIMDGLIVVHHVDGGLGDDDLDPNGVIVDPAAPAFLSDAPPGTGNGCSIASTVNSGSAALNLFIPLIPAIAVGIRYLGRRRRK